MILYSCPCCHKSMDAWDCRAFSLERCPECGKEYIIPPPNKITPGGDFIPLSQVILAIIAALTILMLVFSAMV